MGVSKKIKLIFPPRTSPTYMPLGTAYLAAVAAGNTGFSLYDSNIELWEYVCDGSLEMSAMKNFFRSTCELFLNQENYLFHHAHMADAKEHIDRLSAGALIYAETGELNDELAQILLRQSLGAFNEPLDVIAFSCMYPEQLAFIAAHARYLRDVCDFSADIVIGGASMSAVSPVEMLKAFPFIDAVLTGEGEIPFRLLIDGKPYCDIPGVFFREDGEIEFSGRARHEQELSLINNPDFSVFPMDKYFNPVPVISILGGRGCKWRQCAFCSHNHSFGPHRARPALNIVNEMISLQQLYGCEHFYFADQYVDPVLLEGVCDAILASGLRCRFHIMARTIAAYTAALLQKAAAAGCVWISWGMESGSQAMLDLMRKGTNTGESFEVIKNASEAGISNLLMMIFGAPGSTPERLDETFTFLDRVYPYIDSMTASAFVLFEGTPFSRDPGRYGLEVLERSILFNTAGGKVHGTKLKFKRHGEYGKGESPLAAQEIDMWERRKVWLPELPFIGKLCCEHYLLFARGREIIPRPNCFKRGA
ncbi:MAG: radical SAM protein [Victivallales bacterium]|nr:radical SAM protein [Victivallales bacterium]